MEQKFDPGFRVANWRIFESNWLDIESQIDLISRFKLTWYRDSNWLDIEIQSDLILRVKLTIWLSSQILTIWLSSQILTIWLSSQLLTQIFSNYSESRIEFFFFRQWLNFLGQNDFIFSFSVVTSVQAGNGE